jgi:hypothetical protein
VTNRIFIIDYQVLELLSVYHCCSLSLKRADIPRHVIVFRTKIASPFKAPQWNPSVIIAK